MRKTNFPRLFIYEGEPGRETVSRMQSTEVNLELETRVTDFYMEYWALSLSMEGRAEWQGEFCELGASWLIEERVVLHGDHLLRMKGVVPGPPTSVHGTARIELPGTHQPCADPPGSSVYPKLQRQLSPDGRG